MEKEALRQNVRDWINIDNEIKKLQKIIREKRKEKKSLTEGLVDVMKSNDIECFDITDGQLLYTQTKSKAPLSKKHLLKSLTEYFKNDPQQIRELSKHIMDSREEKVRENIKRKIKK